MESQKEFLHSVSIDRIRSHIEALQGVRHAVAAPDSLERAARYVAGHLAELGYEMGEQRFDYTGRSFRNVIGSRRGAVRHEELILLLAHYDTVENSPGADDNASGVAVLLEVATLLASLRFERSIQFVSVPLEENQRGNEGGSGLIGSRILVEGARQNGVLIQAAVVLESVGYAGDAAVQTTPPGIPFAVPETGDFIAVVGNGESQEIVHAFMRTVERQRLDLPAVPLIVPGNGEVLPDTRRSDHAPFWDAGFRAVMLTDTTNFRNPHYHRPTDTVETLNLDFAARVCAATAAFIADLAVAYS